MRGGGSKTGADPRRTDEGNQDADAETAAHGGGAARSVEDDDGADGRESMPSSGEGPFQEEDQDGEWRFDVVRRRWRRDRNPGGGDDDDEVGTWTWTRRRTASKFWMG